MGTDSMQDSGNRLAHVVDKAPLIAAPLDLEMGGGMQPALALEKSLKGGVVNPVGRVRV